jgi:hypothetical protein
MMRTRRSDERGRADHGWLETYHTFSFSDYFDPQHMGFRTLRAINDDYVAPGAGFPRHPHRDMEIVTWVVEGALEHRDSMGNGSVIRPGDVQRMSAGTGITHSEFNPSADERTRLLQIWILPARRGIEPSYEQKHFDEAERSGRLRLIASPDGRDGSVRLHQDARILAGLLAPGDQVPFEVEPGRAAWIQVVRGNVALGTTELGQGDGVAIEDETRLRLVARDEAEVLAFDLA